MQRKLEYVAEYYGWDRQRVKATEELAELIVALAKNESVANITEEIADVLIMIHQVMILCKISPENIAEIMEFKIDRQIGRIQNE